MVHPVEIAVYYALNFERFDSLEDSLKYYEIEHRKIEPPFGTYSPETCATVETHEKEILRTALHVLAVEHGMEVRLDDFEKAALTRFTNSSVLTDFLGRRTDGM